ncbi:MAG: penicillin-binding protein 2 [Okeania sp. SIO2G4]|uniref:peptidoglycan D,D-transpeptidase FtsI family protein n=1 Tax=unclassified Okeania TaxID=2634635 RepID=UPI0013BDAA98|nr:MULTISPECIES: penicillin-binding protein 2 [unclassified Okeania]NEP71840.1 penicillin-binding protein 2 [Okeania sp. SIO2G5]NEP92860.1 penicillin-binding protein 2 [Okeania sp. SIO2F5]NEQ90937.1 penicillin-binding protein 2 [Okeania sp. SIO2G4]
MSGYNYTSNTQLRPKYFKNKQTEQSSSKLKNKKSQSETYSVKNTHQKLLSMPSRQKPEKCQKSRLYLVWVLLILGLLGLIINLFYLQVLRGKALQEQAKHQQTKESIPFVPRRPIVDRNGNTLAIDKIAYTLYAHPKIFNRSKQEVAYQLSTILEGANLEKTLTSNDLLQMFNERETGIKVADFIPQETTDKITNLFVDGLELIQHPQRVYPQKELAAEVVGYVDGESIGQAGIEYSQQNLLERSVPKIQFRRLIKGVLVPDKLTTGFLQLDDLSLHLTIDSRLQRVTRTILKEQLEEYEAKRGTVIVMDANDGSILSLVSEPSYDPNQYYNYDVTLFKNWAVTDVYEPGSTFKPVNVALALEVGAIEGDSVFYDTGRIVIGNWPIFNSDGSGGARTVTEIIQHSSNVGMVKIVEQMPRAVFYDGLKRLGLGDTTGTDLPFEAPSILKGRNQFLMVPVEAATTAFGQGFSLTPLQLAQLNAALANGGKLVTPHVMRGLFDSKGQPYWQLSLPSPRQVFSSKTTTEVLAMMERVVESGTGKRAKIRGYRIAGKTGTAQKASETGGYSKKAKITSFVGILPMESPRYVVLAVIDEPIKGSGGKVAAPIVKSVIKSLINIEQIPPSDIRSVQSQN